MRRKETIFYLLISFAIIAVDQITKILAAKYLVENEPVSVIGDLLNFNLVYNRGGALGTSLGPPWLYTILTIIALVMIVRYFIISKPDGALIKTSLAMILAGAIGNLIDRFAYGKVIDFIDMDFPDIAAIGLYRWYTYNIADVAISFGLIIFAVSAFFPKRAQEEPAETPPHEMETAHTDHSER